jgi:group II intron reverse transcriptase/maturase
MKGISEMLNCQDYLKLIAERGKDRKPLNRIFSNMLKRPDFFYNAYGKLYANKGAMTEGADGRTVDGTSKEMLDNLISEIREGTFKWTPVVRVYIPKGKGKMRPLGIPTWRDKVVQEVIKVILEAYYEQRFSDNSHGFRPKKGCHTALRQIQRTWTGTIWFIEADIKGCFDNLDHKTLLEILANDIQDHSLLKLIAGLLKAGYLEDWKWNKTYSGTPQGGIISPLLANIYLNELDRFLHRLSKDFDKGKKRANNRPYERLRDKRRTALKKGNQAIAKEALKEMKKLPSKDPYDENYRRLKFVRYADDFVVSVIGTKSEAVKIKDRIGMFLADTLKLELNQEKTLITHAKTQKARFLGYEVGIAKKFGARVALKMPKDVTRKWIGKYSEKGKPHHRSDRIHLSDFEIVDMYGAELRGLYNYYAMSLNVGNELNRVKWVMEQSLAKTLASKHKYRHTKTVYKKYSTIVKGLRAIQVQEDKYTTTFGGISFTRKDAGWEATDVIPEPAEYYGRNELVSRMLADKCEIPGCENTDVEGHHIKALKDLDKYGKNAPIWVKTMRARRRKTLFVCKYHHKLITNGRYDGPALKTL